MTDRTPDLRVVTQRLESASDSVLLALAEARRQLGDNSAVSTCLLMARTELTNATEALEFMVERNNCKGTDE